MSVDNTLANRLFDMRFEDGQQRNPLANLFPSTLPIPSLEQALQHMSTTHAHLHPTNGRTVRIAHKRFNSYLGRIQMWYVLLFLVIQGQANRGIQVSMTRAHADQLVCDNVNVLALDDRLNYHRVLHAKDFAIAGGVNLSATAARVAALEAANGDGSSLQLTGDTPKVEFGGALTLIHNATEDELVCSGKIRASDVIIEGTSTTVADLIGEVATLRQEMAAVRAFVGMMPPPAMPPAAPPAVLGVANVTVGSSRFAAFIDYSAGELWILALAYRVDRSVGFSASGDILPLNLNANSHSRLGIVGLTPENVGAARIYCHGADTGNVIHFVTESARSRQWLVQTIPNNRPTVNDWLLGATFRDDHSPVPQGYLDEFNLPTASSDSWGWSHNQPDNFLSVLMWEHNGDAYLTMGTSYCGKPNDLQGTSTFRFWAKLLGATAQMEDGRVIQVQ